MFNKTLLKFHRITIIIRIKQTNKFKEILLFQNFTDKVHKISLAILIMKYKVLIKIYKFKKVIINFQNNILIPIFLFRKRKRILSK
jgi:hypothetical protein